MKLIIDIEPRYCRDMQSDVKELYYEAINRITEAVRNGKPYDERSHGDLISREALKEAFANSEHIKETVCGLDVMETLAIIEIIDNAPTAEEIEEPFITECRNASIEQNLPLYFVYYGETGILEVYVTETKELFEKRHCSKHLPDYKFKDAVIKYLDWYSDWKGGAE